MAICKHLQNSSAMLTVLVVVIGMACLGSAAPGQLGFVKHIQVDSSHLVELDDTHYLLIRGSESSSSWRVALRDGDNMHIWRDTSEAEMKPMSELSNADRDSILTLHHQWHSVVEGGDANQHKYMSARYSLTSHATDLQHARELLFEAIGEHGVRLSDHSWTSLIADQRVLYLSGWLVRVDRSAGTLSCQSRESLEEAQKTELDGIQSEMDGIVDKEAQKATDLRRETINKARESLVKGLLTIDKHLGLIQDNLRILYSEQ